MSNGHKERVASVTATLFQIPFLAIPAATQSSLVIMYSKFAITVAKIIKINKVPKKII